MGKRVDDKISTRLITMLQRISGLQFGGAILTALFLVVVGWLSLVAWLTNAQDRACEKTDRVSKQDDPFTRQLQRTLDGFSASRNGVGLQASVIFPDGTLRSAAAGYASQEKQCRLTLEHRLYIGSITKVFTAVLVMQQVERGALSLDTYPKSNSGLACRWG